MVLSPRKIRWKTRRLGPSLPDLDDSPSRAKIVLFADYCWQLPFSGYKTRVTGVIFVPEKGIQERLMIEMAEAFIVNSRDEECRPNCTSVSDSEWESDCDAEYDGSFHCEPKMETMLEPESGIEEGWLLSRVVPKALLDIRFRLGTKSLCFSTLSDECGMFHITVCTNHAPAVISATSAEDHRVTQSKTLYTIPLEGLSLISGVDDTVRHSGILQGSEQFIHNVLWMPYRYCRIRGVAEGYRLMDCPVHYVSNTPWQIYEKVRGFLEDANLPVASIHLLRNLRPVHHQPLDYVSTSRGRKHCRVAEIIEDFPRRKFILLGNSAENDLEDYVNVYTRFPRQVVGIYIHALPMGFTSETSETSELVDSTNLTKLQKILKIRKSQKLTTEDAVFGRWLRRVDQVVRRIPRTVPVRLWREPEEVRDECFGLLSKYS